MDSSLLDALECAICLNQLSDSNRVLPCQHTFCLQCLKDVVSARGGLQCPECRTHVDVPVDQLPQNIVLVRLLDTLKAAGGGVPPAPRPARPLLERGVSCDGFAEGSSYIRRNSSSSAHSTNPFLVGDPETGGSVQRREPAPSTPARQPPPTSQPTPAGRQPAVSSDADREAALASLREALAEFDPLSAARSARAPAPSRNPAPSGQKTGQSRQPAVPCARALFDYTATQDGDLGFKKGDIILLRRRVDFDWFEGQMAGNVGVFPANHVTVLTPLANHIPQCRALSQFTFPDQDGKTYLRFNKGEIVTLLRPVDAAWAEGKIGPRSGVFPLTLVELNCPAQSLLRTHGCAPCAAGKPSSAQQAPPLPPPLPVRPARARAPAPAPAGAPPEPAEPAPAAPPRPHRPKPAGSSHHHRAVTRDLKALPASPLIRQQGESCAPAKPSPSRRPPAETPRLPPDGSSDPPPVHSRPSGPSSLGRSGSSLSENPHRPLHRVRSWGADTAGTPNTVITNRNTTRPERRDSDLRRNYRTPTPLVIQRYRCTMDYPPSSDVELELRTNDIVFVHKKRSDGWMKGTHEKTGHTGLFPAIFVEPC